MFLENLKTTKDEGLVELLASGLYKNIIWSGFRYKEKVRFTFTLKDIYSLGLPELLEKFLCTLPHRMENKNAR